MPHKWESPEIFLEYGGITVYHCYTDDNLVSDIWYSVEATNTDADYDLGDGTMFDVTDIPMPGGIDRLAWANEQMIAYAIDRGWLTTNGLTPPDDDEPDQITLAPTVHILVEDGQAFIADKPAGLRVIISDLDPLAMGDDFAQIISEPAEQIKNGQNLPATPQFTTNAVLRALLEETLPIIDEDEAARANYLSDEIERGELVLDLAQRIRQALGQ